jgi:predicted nucleic acid-binding protein
VICVDASVAIKWLLPEDEDHADLALALLHHMVRSGGVMIAPPLMWNEVANALRQRVRRNDLSVDEALAILDDFLRIAITPQFPNGLHRLALDIACRYELPAVYDAYYLALAQVFDCDLWTADRRLIERVQPSLNYVCAISDYSATVLDIHEGRDERTRQIMATRDRKPRRTD